MSNKKLPVRSKNNQIVQSPWYPSTRWCCKHRCCSLLPLHHFHGPDFREPCLHLVLNLPYLLNRLLTLMHKRSKTLVPHVLESTLRASRDTCPATDSFASQLHAKGFNTSGALSLSCFRRSFPMWSNACNFGFNLWDTTFSRLASLAKTLYPRTTTARWCWTRCAHTRPNQSEWEWRISSTTLALSSFSRRADSKRGWPRPPCSTESLMVSKNQKVNKVLSEPFTLNYGKLILFL